MADLYNQGQIHHQKGTVVWVEHPTDVWVKGTISGYSGDDTCEVKREDGQKVTKHVSDLPLANKDPDNGLGEEDMTHLHFLHEAAILHNIRLRYWEGRIYTYTGAMLIAVNPFERLPIYGDDMIEKYRGKMLKENEPHAYAVAEKCYRKMRKDGKSQSMMISGESGAGKTETVKIVMSYLAAVSGSTEMSRISDAVLQSNPILEAFGNAKTLRNDNSSRFGKFIEIQFNKKGEVAGAYIKTYLLEKSRVIRQTEGERGFHVFYQLCAGYNALHPDDPLPILPADEYNYLSGSKTFAIAGIDDANELSVTKRAMDVVGISESEQRDVFRAVAAVLALGQITFANDPKREDASICTDTEALDTAAELLGVQPEALNSALSSRRIFAAGESYTSPHSLEQALAARDALAKGLYGRLFLWLVERINKSIRNDSQSVNFIGILDIFGFESFQTNSFEQFCINFANEKLQQQFIRNVLKSEQEEYMAENIAWQFVDFKDNQECLELIEKRPLGILSLLDEECMFPKGSDDSFANKVLATHGPNSYLEKPSMKIKSAFVIRHYARQVCYASKGFLDKNKDSLHPDAIAVIQDTSWRFVASLFPDSEFPKVSSTKSGPKAGILAVTVGTQFKDQLGSLMERVGSTDQHYICCIKPNSVNKPRIFESGMTSLQLSCAGVLEAIKVSRLMYPYRLRHPEFVAKFKFLCPPLATTDMRSYCEYLLKTLATDRDKYEFGLTKVFFRPGTLEELEEIRLQSLAKVSLVIQRYYKGYLARRWYHFVRRNIVLIQTVLRTHRARAARRRLRLAQVAIGLQAVCRMRLARHEYRLRLAEFMKRAIIDIPAEPETATPPPELPTVASSSTSTPASSDAPPRRAASSGASRQTSANRLRSQSKRSSAPAAFVVGAAARRMGPTNYQGQDGDEFDETRAVELHCGDLAALLTNNFEKWQQIYGFKQFYRLYERKVHFLCSVPAFNDRNLVGLVLNALKSGPSAQWNEEEWTAALLALIRLFSKPDENCTTIWKMQGVLTVMLAMQRYPNDARIQSHALAIIANLSRHDDIRRAMRSQQVVRVVLNSMIAFQSDQQIQRHAAIALDYLMSPGMKDSKEAMKAVLRAMQTHPLDAPLQIAGMSVIGKYCSTGLPILNPNKKIVGKNGGIEVIITAMRAHPEDVKVHQAAIAALLVLASNSKNRGAMRHYTGDQLVQNSIAAHADNPIIQHDGSRLLSSISK